jgi:hypothetical protein
MGTRTLWNLMKGGQVFQQLVILHKHQVYVGSDDGKY